MCLVKIEDTQRSASRPSSAHRQFLRAHENTGAEHMRSQSANGSRRGSVDSIFNKVMKFKKLISARK